MFAAINSIPGIASEFETKKALLVINCQNDSFYELGDFRITSHPEYVQVVRDLIPYFRRIGDVIWVCTELGTLPSEPSPDVKKIGKDSVRAREENRKALAQKEANMRNDMTNEKSTVSRSSGGDARGKGRLMQTYDPSSRIKRLMTHAPAVAKAEKRSFNLQSLDGDDGDRLEDRLVKPRKGQQSKFYVAGTYGAEIADQLKDLRQEDDIVITKHFYSTFDQTELLTTLRTELITEVYLCGGLTNTSIYSTAADAVQHGLEVNVITDCLGWRSMDKHEEALHQMSDIMGVTQISSEDIIEQSGGRVIPDSETPGITITELSMGAKESEAQAALMADQGCAPGQRPMHLDEQDPNIPKPSGEGTDESNPTTPTSTVAETQPQPSARQRARSRQISLGPDDRIASGDSQIIYDWLDEGIAGKAFGWLKEQVEWQTMDHRGGQVPRLVAVQGQTGKDGEVPIYRHPADESPPLSAFSPTVLKMKRKLESLLDQPFNHVLIQLYRTGDDNISEHADKTLDIVRDSRIVNVSLGAQRVMTLRTKKTRNSSGLAGPPGVRSVQRVPMPHNSVFVLGPQSNREWLHGVRADKRPAAEKTEGEKAFNGERISLTFRHIGTYMNEGEQLIWGTGAKNKTKSTAALIANEDPSQMEQMVIAFGKENHQANFDWDAEYGPGFDVVNLKTKPNMANLAFSSDPIVNLRVQLSLEEAGLSYRVVDRNSLPASTVSSLSEKPYIHGLANTDNPILTFLNPGEGPFEGDLAILLALERRRVNEQHSYTTAQLYSCIAQSNELLYLWYELRHTTKTPDSTARSPTHRFSIENNRPPTPEVALRRELKSMLKGWEDHFAANPEQPYLAGDFWSVIDCAFWPVFRGIIQERWLQKGHYPNLVRYHERALEREGVRKVLGR